MRDKLSHRFLHLVLFIFSVILPSLKIIAATSLGDKCIDNERRALLDFKSYIVQDPNDLLSTWMTHEEATNDCCNWRGVTCNNQTGHVTSLDLSVGWLEGYVPVWIGEKFSELYVLSLTSNNFFGTIPLQLCRLVKLQILDLSMNNLYGTIPSCLNNLTAMVQGGFSPYRIVHRVDFDFDYVDYEMINWQGIVREFRSTLGLVKSIDLSSNNLTGYIPYELADLHELITLNLSMNALDGEIPSKIGFLKSLLHLDLSRNNLSGRIPTSMSQMTSLAYLNVSCNNLSGRIPSSTQLQSFEPSSYTENVRLCGLPLTKSCPGDKEIKVPPVIGQSEGSSEGIDELDRWFYIGGATGFLTGFWIICGTLLGNRRWRNVFFSYY